MKSQKVFVLDLWRFGIEAMIKYNMNVLLAKIFDERTLLENYYNLEIPFVQFLREIYKQLGKESESKSFDPSLQTTSEISEYSSIPSLFSDCATVFVPDSFPISLLNMLLDLVDSNLAAVTRLVKVSNNTNLVKVCENLLKLGSNPVSSNSTFLSARTMDILSHFIIAKWKEDSCD